MTRTGRHAVYELSDPGLEVLLPLLDRITGRLAPPPPESPMTDYRRAHTCYDHLAGRLGVALYRALLDRGALRALPDGTVELGPAATETFASIGIDTAQLPKDRRRFAFECLDVVEHAPHLAGAVGDTVAAAFTEKGWITPQPDSRTLQLNPRALKALRRASTSTSRAGQVTERVGSRARGGLGTPQPSCVCRVSDFEARRGHRGGFVCRAVSPIIGRLQGFVVEGAERQVELEQQYVMPLLEPREHVLLLELDFLLGPLNHKALQTADYRRRTPTAYKPIRGGSAAPRNR